jgi:Na+-transporting NADH:ubiquinone oxidoreductase subunit A
MHIKLSKGLDMPMTGSPEQIIETGAPVGSVALLGEDYTGLKPKMLAEVGDRVQLGQALFIDKRDPAVQFTAPGSGTVSAINRGARRALQSVVIELDSTEPDESPYATLTESTPDSLPTDEIRAALCTSGLWTAFRTRPFNKVPQSNSEPHSIFVTAMDTQPLAGNPELVGAQHAEAFALGLALLTRLTAGNVHVCTGPEWSLPVAETAQIKHSRFSGPHPAGLPGTHIHYLDPVSADRSVWHIGYQDVIAIGKLFATGRIWTKRTVALGGAGFARPRLVTTRQGANTDELTANELKPDMLYPQRLISGSVLTGRAATEANAYLGRYHLQISTLDDRGQRRLFGWLGLFNGSYSFASRLARRQDQQRLHDFSTAQHGRPTALIPIDAFDRIIPMDMLTVPLLKSLLIRDTDQAQALGCLELDAEDLALCSFVCPGKNDYGTALKLNLEQIERDG